MKKKIRVALLCGGKSAEHEVSLLSAQNIYQSLDKKKYDVVIIGIDKNGRWFLHKNFTNLQKKQLSSLHHSGQQIAYSFDQSNNFLITNDNCLSLPIDVIFPVLHGPYGEDGTVQGFLKLMNLPFVGSGVVGSALGMDKDVMKRLLIREGINVANFLVFKLFEKKSIQFEQLQKKLGLPFFIKPANLGSSVGVTKVHTKEEFKKALQKAFSYDTKILVEEEIKGREIECSILGNDEMRASVPGEVIPHDEFYSYKAKYIDKDGAELVVPARLTKAQERKIQYSAIKAAQVLCVEGMARVDFFLTPTNKVIVNEINTIPGFTEISMYPKLWKASGISYSQLVDKLIQLAIERHKREQKLLSSPLLSA